MRTLSLLLILSLPVIARSQDDQTSAISPAHSISIDEGGWLELSDNGFWLSHMTVAEDRKRPVKVYHVGGDGNSYQTNSPMTFGGFSANSNYFHDAEYLAHPKYEPKLFRLWDLRRDDGDPILKFHSKEYVGGATVNAEGTHAAGVAIGDGGVRLLRIWDLSSPDLGPDSYIELGPVGGRIWLSQFAFTVNRGIVVLTDAKLKRWDLDHLREPPASLPLNATKISISMGYWIAGTSKIRDIAAVHWVPDGSDRKETLLSDFPTTGVSRPEWRLFGQPKACFDQVVIEGRSDHTYRLTLLNDFGHSTHKLFGPSFGNLTYLMPIVKRGKVLMSQLNANPDGVSIGFQTYIASYLEPDMPPQLIDQLGDMTVLPAMTLRNGIDYARVPSYAMSASQRWLASVSSFKKELWDLTRPIADQTPKPLPGVDGPVKHVVVADRWLILATIDGKLFAVDLESENVPEAKRFFSLAESYVIKKFEAAGNTFFISDFKTVHVWNGDMLNARLGE